MRVFWMSFAAVCIAAALVLLFRHRLDAAFVLGTVGIVAGFLNYRVQLKQVIASDETDSDSRGLDLDENEHS